MVISCRRFARPRNNAPRIVQTSNQSLTGTPITNPPASARSTKPIAIDMTSRITMCFNHRVYKTKSARYAEAETANIGCSQ